MGLIVLAENLDDLPEYCGTILQITPEGRCQVSNHLGEQILGTPIGITAGFAAASAATITDAIGDDTATFEPPADGEDLADHGDDIDDIDDGDRHDDRGDPHEPLAADDFVDELNTLFGPELPSPD